MVIEIDKDTIDNRDVRSAIRTLRKYGMHPYKDGYYHGYLTDKQYISLLNDPKIMNLEIMNEIVGAIPAVYGCKFFRITQENQPARFYGRHSTDEVELVEVNP